MYFKVSKVMFSLARSSEGGATAEDSEDKSGVWVPLPGGVCGLLHGPGQHLPVQ